MEGWVASEGHSLLHLQMLTQRCYFNAGILEAGKDGSVAVSAGS